MITWLGKLLGIDGLESVHEVSVGFAAPWAAQRPALVIFACLAVIGLAILFYLKGQQIRHRGGRITVTTIRALLLALIVLILAEPIIALATTEKQRPLLLLLFDTTDSMNIEDNIPAEQLERLREKYDLGEVVDQEGRSRRGDLMRAVISGDPSQTLERLAERFRIRAYAMQRADLVRELRLGEREDELDVEHLLAQVDGEGEVTALGAALADLDRRHHAHQLAGVVVISDFDQNTGPPALPIAEGMGPPFFTVGVGPREVIDLAVELQTPLMLKKEEATAITAHLRQSGLLGRTVSVQLYARRLGVVEGSDTLSDSRPVGDPQRIELREARQTVSIPWTPEETGRFVLSARVEPFADEVLSDNNAAVREVDVRDDSLRLLFVEYEPTWEWRFVKEVFQRDPLIGREGFRTYLQSSDFKVRQSNDLFLETLIRPRSEFFAYDVIFISDVPGEMLSDHFQQMLKEYVSRFGGGLVILSGPRFGPQALAETELADMLPIIPDRQATRRDADFRIVFTPESEQYGFMRLGDDEAENERAWENMGALQWYQPVARTHPLATVLATHPTDRAADEQTPQPLIAVRRYGKGEVIYLGFNETWRLRRLYNEQYYRQFWGQMIYRLGLGRAMGAQKRFHVETDRQAYQAGDKVRISVEAYDQDFEPLRLDRLEARLLATSTEGGQTPAPTRLTIPLSRDEVVFETTVPVFTAGEHRLLVRDPETGDEVEVNFKVEPVTVERRSAVRHVALQSTLAARSGGVALEIEQWSDLPDLIDASGRRITRESRFPLWNTWLIFVLGVGLMLSEWLGRKLMNLP